MLIRLVFCHQVVWVSLGTENLVIRVFIALQRDLLLTVDQNFGLDL
jgi:hypothetical protein